MARPLADPDLPDPLDIAVGARIRARRRWLEFSQTQLADALGITFQQVQKYENAANRVSASMLVKIAAKLETTVAALVGESTTSPPERIVFTELGAHGASEMLAAYAEISDSEARRALVTLVKSLAGGSRSSAREGRGLQSAGPPPARRSRPSAKSSGTPAS